MEKTLHLNVHEPNNIASQYIRHKFNRNGGNDFTTIIGNSNTFLPVTDGKKPQNTNKGEMI